jgi:hypothetical protein
MLRVFEQQIFGEIVDFMTTAFASEAEARSRPRGQPFERTRWSDVPNRKLTPDEVMQARELMQAEFAKAELGIRQFQSFGDGAIDEARASMEQMKALFFRMLDRAGEVGVQQAYLEAIGELVPAPTSSPVAMPRKRAIVDDIGTDRLFASRVARVVRELFGGSEEDAQAVIRNLALSDCPGQWLTRAVELEIQRNEWAPEAGNANDLQHLAFWPYVDVYLTDAAMGTYVTAVLRRDNVPQSVRRLGRPTPKWCAHSLDAIEAVLN